MYLINIFSIHTIPELPACEGCDSLRYNSWPGKVYYSGDLFDSEWYNRYNTRNDLYEHLSEEVIKMNRSEQLMAGEGLLFWRPL